MLAEFQRDFDARTKAQIPQIHSPVPHDALDANAIRQVHFLPRNLDEVVHVQPMRKRLLPASSGVKSRNFKSKVIRRRK